jgi:hypothetical protein
MSTRAPVTIRASSFGALFDCPARWTAIHREGRRTPSRANAAIGQAVHKGTALFDTEVLHGQAPSVEAAKDAAVQTIEHPREEIDWDEDKPAQAKDIAASLTERYCTIFAPTVEYAAVEIGVDSLRIDDLAIILTGTTDRVRKTADGLGIADLKTGKQAVGTDGRAKTHGHAGQLGVYELVAEAGMGVRMDLPAQVVGLQTNVTPEKQRIGTGEVHGAKEVLIGTEDHVGLLHTAAQLAHGDIVFGNPKSMMCSERYCPAFTTCFFRR